MRAPLPSFGCALVLLSQAPTARAAPPVTTQPAVEIATAPCLPTTLDAAQFAHALSIELPEARLHQDPGADAAPPGPPPTGNHLAIRVEPESCNPDESAYVVVFEFAGPGGRPSRLTSSVSLHDVTLASRPRALALAIAELVRVAVDVRSAASATAPPTPSTAPAVDEDEQGKERRAPIQAQSEDGAHAANGARRPSAPARWMLDLRAGIWARTSSLPAFLGGGAGVALRATRWLEMRAGLDAAYSEGRVDYLNLGVVTLAPNVAVEFVVLDVPRITVGPRFALPIAFVAAESEWNSERTRSWMATLTGGATLAVPLAGVASIVVSAELGGYLRELTLASGDRSLVHFSGLTGAGTLGLALSF